MEEVFTYFENHYILFIFLTALMLFALIGYFAKKKADQDKPFKLADENAMAEQELESMAKNVSKTASIQDFVNHNVTYQQPVQAAPQAPAATPQAVAQPVVQQPTVTAPQAQVTPQPVETLDVNNNVK